MLSIQKTNLPPCLACVEYMGSGVVLDHRLIGIMPHRRKGLVVNITYQASPDQEVERWRGCIDINGILDQCTFNKMRSMPVHSITCGLQINRWDPPNRCFESFTATHVLMLAGGTCMAVPLSEFLPVIGVSVWFCYRNKTFNGFMNEDGLIDSQAACFLSAHFPVHIGEQFCIK